MSDKEILHLIQSIQRAIPAAIYGMINVSVEAANEIVELLKEQEAVEPIKMQRMDDNFSFFVPYFLCGNCRYELVGKDVMFCSHCGRPVKWNE